MAYSLHDIKVTGIDLSEVLSCRIAGGIGEHSSLELCAVLACEEDFLYEMPSYQPMEVRVSGKEGEEVLFSGIITDIRLSAASGIKIVNMEGRSCSWLMDLAKRSRSFQDPRIGYDALLSQVIAGYPGSAAYYAAPQRPIGNLMLQYEETDWEFLKRSMSLQGITVTPDSSQAGIRLYAGVPVLTESKSPCRILKMDKDMETYYSLKANGRQVFAPDFTRYRAASKEVLRIFETMEVSGQPLTVYSYEYDFRGQEMTGFYGFQMARGLVQAAVYPMHLIGTALIGKIVNVSGDKVQVALEIDRESGSQPACWFPYSTISASPDGSGWYCMPENGDDVRVYFPSKYEKEAIALSAVSGYQAPGEGQSDRMADPNSRYLRTKAGQELALAPGYMRLSCGKGASSLTINNDGKIMVNAAKTVEVTAEQSLTIHGEESLTLHSKELLALQSTSGGNIQLGDGNAQFQGTTVNFD